ncbi:hypothetical protein Tco_0252046 [Tanacetum coccineum]
MLFEVGGKSLSSAKTSIFAWMVAKKGLRRIVVSEGELLMITKSERNKNLPILTKTFSTTPKGAFLDISVISHSIFVFLKLGSVKFPGFNSLRGSWCCKTSVASLSGSDMKDTPWSLLSPKVS